MIFINEYDLINEYQGKPYGIHRLSMYSFVVSCLINKNRSKTSFLIDYESSAS